MNRTFIPLLILFSVVCLAGTQGVRAEHLPIKVYTSADGLGSSFVNSLMSDSRGFLWICTRDGLSRFDGGRFVTYQVGDKNAPPGIEDIIETSKGIYWITTTSGLYRFDPDAPIVATGARSAQRPVLNAEFVGDSRGFLFEDHNGNIWSGGHGFYRVQETGHQLTFQKIGFDLLGISADAFAVSMICEGRDGSLWLASTEGLIRRQPDGRSTLYTAGPRRADGFSNVLEDNEGRIWFSGVNGVYVLKPGPLEGTGLPGSLSVQRLEKKPGQQTRSGDRISLPAQPGEAFEVSQAEGNVTARPRFLSKTSDGEIWISNTLTVIEYDGHTFHTHTSDQGFIQGIERVVEDRSGNVWMSGTNGLMRLDRGGLTSYKVIDGLGDPYTVNINRTLDGKLYTTGSNLTLSIFNGQGFHSITSPVPPGSQTLWSSNPVFQDSRGEWWFLTNGKLYRFAATGDFQALAQQRPRAIYDSRDGLKGDAMFHIFEDSRGDLWVSTNGPEPPQYGLSRFSRATERFSVLSRADGFPDNKAPSSFAEDRAGNLWFGFYQGGAVRYHDGHFTELSAADGLPSGLITALYPDQKGRIWVGSASDGLSRIDDPTVARPRFVSLNSANGLASNNVRSITGDLFGNIYVGTARGVDRFTADAASIRHYSINDGLAGDFVSTAFRDAGGSLWFGTPSGLSRLVPAPDQPVAAPPIWVSGLRIAGESRSVPELGSAAISNLELGPAQNNLQIDFLAIDFNAGEDLRYQYMLEGADKDWGAATPSRTVNYANLAAGSYRFMVRAVNTSGLASVKPATVSFRVLAPFWRRWWFIVIAVILLCAGVFSMDRYRVARVRERQRAEVALQHAREERLVELERVRKRIASDLHDDIGSSLTQISLLSEVVNRSVDRDNLSITQPLAMIANSSRELVDAMSDIVWAINPQKDHLSDLTQRMRSLASEVFTACGIRFRFSTPHIEVDLPLGANLRREVFLIFKESVNNVIKHSGATEADIEFRVDQDHLFLKVADNGKGFDAGQESEGHGLISMRSRGQDIGGKLEMASGIGKGTTITLWVSLKNAR